MADPSSFRVSPTLQGLPRLTSPAVDSAGPKQMIALGEATQRAGTVAGSIYEDVLKEQNATRVTEALTDLTKYAHERTYGEGGWATLKGKNALERPNDKPLDQEVGDDLNEHVENLSLRLGNDAQRKAFREHAQALSVDLQGKIQAHVANEGFTYQQEVLTGAGDSYARIMSETDDPQEMMRNRDAARAAYGKLADLQGVAGEARDEFLQKALTPGHLAALERMQAAGAVDAAEAYFNQFRGDLTLEAASRVNSALVEQRAIMDGGDVGEQIFGMTSQQNAASAPQLVQMPVIGDFRRTGSFGDKRPGHLHDGIDMAMPTGTPVHAGASGIAHIKHDPEGYGLYVDLKLDDGTTLRMAHLSETEIKDGDRVSQGQVIAKSGSSGRSTGPHLHYSVIQPDGTKVDPATWHQGKPSTTPSASGQKSLQDMLQDLYSRNLPPKVEQEAERKIRSLQGATEQAKRDDKESALSRAYAEIDSSGTLSASTRSRLVSLNLGDSIPSLRSFEKATQDRKAGVTIGKDDAALNYGLARQMIADGKVNSVQDLIPLKPYLAPSDFKQLTDDVAKSPQIAREKADKVISMMNEEIEGSGLFADKKGKQGPDEKKAFSRFIGATTKQIEAEESYTGKPVGDERQREIVLGMLAQQVISATGDKKPGYEIRSMYDNIPASERLRITRDLQRHNIPVPSQSQVVSTWLRMQGQ